MTVGLLSSALFVKIPAFSTMSSSLSSPLACEAESFTDVSVAGEMICEARSLHLEVRLYVDDDCVCLWLRIPLSITGHEEFCRSIRQLGELYKGRSACW